MATMVINSSMTGLRAISTSTELPRRKASEPRGALPIHACTDVLQARSLAVAPVASGEELHWTPRGLAVALLVIALFTVAVVVTVVVQFLAVSDAPLDLSSQSGAVRAALMQVGG